MPDRSGAADAVVLQLPPNPPPAHPPLPLPPSHPQPRALTPPPRPAPTSPRPPPTARRRRPAAHALAPMASKLARHLAQRRAALLAFVPALLWIFLFTSGVSLIPDKAKPPINVTLLPAIDRTFFFSSLKWFPTEPPVPALDFLAAVPYTLHASLPFTFIAVSLALPALRPSIPTYVATFGTMNLAAVLTHLAFPTAPPWYAVKYGATPANYSMKGDPAILARVDERYGIDLFHKMYEEGGKVVFGAFPSLHAAWPYLIVRQPALPTALRVFMTGWMLVVWWAAIYLQHHFAVDVLGGVLYAEASIALVSIFLPHPRNRYKPVPLKDSDTPLPVVVTRAN